MPTINFGFDDYETTYLSYAAYSGDEIKITSLIAEKIDLNEKDERGKTALFYSAYKNFSQITLLLLNSSAEIQDDLQWHMCQAVTAGSLELVDVLIKRGANLNTEDKGGRTPLTTSVIAKRHNVTLELLKLGADINRPGIDGLTPLQLAVKCLDIDVFKILIHAGANVDAINIRGQSTLRFIQDYQHIDFSENSRVIFIELLKKQKGKLTKILKILQPAFLFTATGLIFSFALPLESNRWTVIIILCVAHFLVTIALARTSK